MSEEQNFFEAWLAKEDLEGFRSLIRVLQKDHGNVLTAAIKSRDLEPGVQAGRTRFRDLEGRAERAQGDAEARGGQQSGQDRPRSKRVRTSPEVARNNVAVGASRAQPNVTLRSGDSDGSKDSDEWEADDHALSDHDQDTRPQPNRPRPPRVSEDGGRARMKLLVEVANTYSWPAGGKKSDYYKAVWYVQEQQAEARGNDGPFVSEGAIKAFVKRTEQNLRARSPLFRDHFPKSVHR